MLTMLFGQAYISDGPSGPKMEHELGTPAERSPKTLDDRNAWGTLERYPVSLVPSYCVQNVCLTTSGLTQASAKATWAKTWASVRKSVRVFGAAWPGLAVEHWRPSWQRQHRDESLHYLFGALRVHRQP